MSFVGSRKSLSNTNSNEVKIKERIDENLKLSINDKIWEIGTKNNTIREKV
jgi:hypothetical protein